MGLRLQRPMTAQKWLVQDKCSCQKAQRLPLSQLTECLSADILQQPGISHCLHLPFAGC